MTRWAHPRSRGENLWSAGKSLIDGGSSPLTRGKRGAEAAQGALSRLIPAHAGKTRNSRMRSECHWAHPRSRGENNGNELPRRAFVGSSPLTRGKPPTFGSPGVAGGLIPAHAGKTTWH